MSDTSQLSKNPVFSSLPLEKLERVQKLSISRNFQKGEFVTLQEDIWPYLLLVNKGKFNAIKESGQGRVFVIETFLPGEMFWGLALFETDEPNPMAIQAAVDGEMLLWHKNQVEEIIADYPGIAWGIFSLFAEKMARASEIVEELVFRPLSGRLANLLLEKFEGATDRVVARDLTLDEMAARIGSTREMVCKILYQFADKGIIDIHRTEFKINDQDSLVNIAEKMKG